MQCSHRQKSNSDQATLHVSPPPTASGEVEHEMPRHAERGSGRRSNYRHTRVGEYRIVRYEWLALQQIIVILGIVMCHLVLLPGEGLDCLDRLPQGQEQEMRDGAFVSSQHGDAEVARCRRVVC